MSNVPKNPALDERLYHYLINHSLREADVLAELRSLTSRHPLANMQIAPEQGQFMAWLVQLMGARRILEIGVFTGYSSTCMALALPEGGLITACDVSHSYTDIARRFWVQAGVEHKIDLHIGFALDTLNTLIENGAEGYYDLVFIDADKLNYSRYYERALILLRQGGVIVIDNVLWGGKVADPEVQDEDTEAIRQLNQLIHQDPRVSLSMLPVADGLSLCIKR